MYYINKISALAAFKQFIPLGQLLIIVTS